MESIRQKSGRRPRGRPPIPAAQRRSIALTIRVTAQERARLRTEAERRGITLTELLLLPWRAADEGDKHGRRM